MNLFKSILTRLDRNEREHDLLNDLCKHFEQQLKIYDIKTDLNQKKVEERVIDIAKPLLDEIEKKIGNPAEKLK